MSLPFLLEVGCEEIPDWMIDPALNSLQDAFQVMLDQRSLGGRVASVEATPRRLMLAAGGILERQADSEELLLGPPKSAGPGAAAGFARKMGVAPDQLGSQTTAKGEYFVFAKRTQGQAAAAILAADLPQLILKIPWPKTMYWNGKGSERFIRPIRWIVALLADAVVPFELAGVRSGSLTAGHRILGERSIPVTIGNYAERLRENFVEVVREERRARIAKFAGGAGDPDLVNTLKNMTEWPTPITGSFDAEYLALPEEVLVTVMRHHQRYFAVRDSSGNLTSRFIAVMNTNADPDGLVRQGHERVLRARFNDARFFWQVDGKRRLEDRLPDLAHVTFQAQCGSYLDKTHRVVKLVRELGGGPAAQRAALLCKTDLTTGMVKELPELQGVMGGLYAKAQNEPNEVWRAIYDHYRPVSMEDALPAPAGLLLAFADKWDTLTSCFNAGLVPTGSKDPFALRRAAQALVRLVVEGKVEFGFVLQNGPLRDFLRDRVEHYFREAGAFAYDEVRACMAAGWSDLLDLQARLERVRAIRHTPDFEPIAAGFKRIQNILRQAGIDAPGSFDPALLEDGPERALYDEYRATQGLAFEKRLPRLRPRIDLFFDAVLVNAPDPAVRGNRLAFLKTLLSEFSTIADFSEIVTEGTQASS